MDGVYGYFSFICDLTNAMRNLSEVLENDCGIDLSGKFFLLNTMKIALSSEVFSYAGVLNL